jgi:hypothetical protein
VDIPDARRRLLQAMSRIILGTSFSIPYHPESFGFQHLAECKNLFATLPENL